MFLGCCKAAILLAAVASSSACNVSLQSSQFTFLKTLLESEPEAPERNWQVKWDGRVYSVYAVNHESGVYFANEAGLVASFDGSQVTSLSLPGARNKNIIQVESVPLDDGSISLQFQNKLGGVVESHKCSSWQLFGPQDGSKGRVQQCVNGTSVYTNEIWENDLGQIVALKQILATGVAPIVIAQRF